MSDYSELVYALEGISRPYYESEIELIKKGIRALRALQDQKTELTAEVAELQAQNSDKSQLLGSFREQIKSLEKEIETLRDEVFFLRTQAYPVHYPVDRSLATPEDK